MSEARSIGFLPEHKIERAFKGLLYVVAVALALLSVVGNFYYFIHRDASLNILTIVRDVLSIPDMFGFAVLYQAIFTLLQYGSRVMAKSRPLFWILYLIALAFSVWPNIESFVPALTVYMSIWIAIPVIIGNDIVPEWIAVKGG